ncbi:uncharacterized protein N7483_007212 [Penicillium malachiteum]|uniref:uncharacterized protein n=1 Tax=Penicillium malachiteum TaxID=1324776 RepID=UPI0025477369|nr:uncharacterized protein N7483_007212 [Penicillium malachiteum]KAJ5725855.1 hypothetical protein N7483_007212 [Penicillium malachiteum]
MRVVIISTIFTGLATLFVALRLWTRFKLVHSPGYDDILIVGSLLSCYAFFAFILVERSHGLGVNIADLSPEVIEDQMRYLWLSVPFYNLSLILSKLSALFLYIRIFRGRGFLLATYITMACLIAAGLWMVISGFVFCVPINDFWELHRNDQASHCLPEGPVWYSNAAMQIVSDIVIMILPMPVLSKLQLPLKQKAGIMLVFGLGVFVIATSSARLYELSTMVSGRDFTEKNAEAAVWSSLEANVSIICACMPPLHPLLSRLFALCFRPIPLHSSPASKAHSNTTCLTETRKPSIYDHHGVIGPDGGIFFNDFFYAGPGSYMASVAKLENEREREKDCENENGIRVVRELRMESDSVPFPNGGFLTTDYYNHGGHHDLKERDIEMGRIGEGSGSSGKGTANPSIEWDLGGF